MFDVFYFNCETKMITIVGFKLFLRTMLTHFNHP